MVAATEGSALRVEGTIKSFPTLGSETARTSALDNVSLSVEAGELISLVGPSGCGKSTLLRLIAGLDAPDTGQLSIGDDPITGPAAERGLVFQDPNLFPWLSGNVWQWTADWYRPDYYAHAPASNPPGPADSFDPAEPGVAKKVTRGGSFLCSDCYCGGFQSGSRSKSSPDTGLPHTGFRCVRSAEASATARR